MKHRKVECIIQDHSAGNGQSWDLNQQVVGNATMSHYLSPSHFLPSLSLGIFTWYPRWPLQAAVRTAGMQMGRLAQGLQSAHTGSDLSSVPEYETPRESSHAHSVTPFPQHPLWSLWPSCMCSPASTFTFPMHTPHGFHTQAWSDTVAREAIVLGQSSV